MSNENEEQLLEIKQLQERVFLLENDNFYKGKMIIGLQKKCGRLTDFLEMSNEIYMLRIKNRFIYISPAYQKVFHDNPDEIKTQIKLHYQNIISENYTELLDWNKDNIIVRKELCFHIDNERKWFDYASYPIVSKQNIVLRRVEVYYDITDKKEHFTKMLVSPLVPICSSCKKVREEDGTWHDIEDFVRKCMPIEFTHTICPVCADRLYGKYFNK